MSNGHRECVISGKDVIQIYRYDVRIVRCKISQDTFPYPLLKSLHPGESEPPFLQTSVATKEKVKRFTWLLLPRRVGRQ
jgi:hypothetical protein